jgi:ATP/maltotriose-dependent transcriptional regulator MalT
MVLLGDHLVGRADELDSLERLLDGLDRGGRGAIEVVGEPGIGKTRLLQELAVRAEVHGHLVLGGSASELEHDLPFSVFVDALDEFVRGLDREWLAVLDDQVRAELAHVFPSLWALADGREPPLLYERHRSHRAVRQLLERLAERSPLVLVLDDVQWADPASLELLGALLRRPPGAVLIALGMRSGQPSERLSTPLARAHRAGLLTLIELRALSAEEAREFLGATVDAAAAVALYDESGGNPFYLEQLARSQNASRGGGYVPDVRLVGAGVPAAVAASLTEELAQLSAAGRLVLEGAAVAGDPFEPELAAASAATPESAAIDAVDELLRFDLIRSTDVPRRFRFRHPLVRRAIYEATPGGWRLGAHQRCAQLLAAKGATAAARAHHVERSSQQGDLAAVAILREAGEAAERLAPDSAALWFGGALRLLPQTASAEDRIELLLARARALAAAGHFADSHEALLDAIAIVPDQSSALRTTVTTACARAEHRLGQYKRANARLVRALSGLPEPASVESVGLLIELALNEFYRSTYHSMRDWAASAETAARELGDAPLLAAALAMPALADAMTGASESAQSRRAAAAALVDDLADDKLSLRLDAAVWLAAAELYLDRYLEADEHGTRALTLARGTGQGELAPVLHQILGRVWYVRAKLADATQLLDEAIEASHLSGNTQALVGNLFNRSVVAVAVGDMDLALSTAQESVKLARELDHGFVAAWAAVRYASVLLETGEPARAVELLLSSAGGEELTSIPGGWRAYALDLLTRCWLVQDCRSEALRTVAVAEVTASAVRLPLAAAWADRAVAAVALHAGDTARAAERALTSAHAAQEVGAPIEAALSRVLAGRALGQGGRRDRGVAELQRAAAAFDTCGALRYRNQAERELRKLGHHVHRRTQAGRTNGSGIEALTERELQVARLVVERKTNAQIAAELFLSQKTIETHLRNIFGKMRVESRVDVARTLERADHER